MTQNWSFYASKLGNSMSTASCLLLSILLSTLLLTCFAIKSQIIISKALPYLLANILN